MTLGLMGKKIGMTQVFDAEGLAIPVTVVQLGANIVTAKLTQETNGYNAVQVGGFTVQEKKLTRPQAGHLKKSQLPLLAPLKEFRVEDVSPYNIGEGIQVEAVLKEGTFVDVRGRSIGKGFQGTIKRYNAHRGPMSHGSKFHRSMGSIGQHTDPGRVFKGLHMPGNMGNEAVCAHRLTVVQVDTKKGLVLIKGSVPGVEGGLLVLSPTKTKWNS